MKENRKTLQITCFLKCIFKSKFVLIKNFNKQISKYEIVVFPKEVYEEYKGTVQKVILVTNKMEHSFFAHL